MGDNLIFLLNKLTYHIVNQELEKEKNFHPSIKNERFLKKCVRRVRQRGCDVLLNKIPQPLLPDPCVTDYGGNWSPVTLITDYGRELKAQGLSKSNDIIVNSINILEEKQYNCLNDLLKLLLLLKKPLPGSCTQLQQSVSDFLQNSIDSVFSLIDEIPNDGWSKRSYKKAIQYEESWTKHFDSKFQVLGEMSKKNLMMPEKISLDSIFTSKNLNKSQSQANSFVFTDFFMGKNFQSDKNLLHLNLDSANDDLLLDSFVDTPITHKLPGLTVSLGSDNLSVDKNGSGRQVWFPDEDTKLEDDRSVKSSEIELKRNSNCSHSFSTLYEKLGLCKSQESSLGSCDSKISFRSRRKSWNTSSVCSKEIVLGLWEEEQALIKNFRPELAVNFPSLRMISRLEFVEDVKYLMTGINSGTFQFSTNNNCYNMTYGTCLEDVTPESLYHFSKEFLDIGNSYLKLNRLANEIGRNNFDKCTTISQAFWKSIFDFLELHYSVVLEIPATTNLIALKSCTKDLHDMITTVAGICKVSKPDESLPQGGELITYLLKVTEKLSKPCVSNIVFGILQNCCNVYIMCILQTWMFKGHLEKQTNEFFVDHLRAKMKTHSRAYYKSFFIAEEKIPVFLKGYEESIFNCGKSIHFLKLFNAEDKFCQLLEKGDYPNMCLCLTDDQLQKVETKFEKYQQQVIKCCGGSISIKALRDEEKEKEKCYLEYVKECKKIQEQQRELLKLKELEKLKAKKEQKNKLLNEQRNIIEAEKGRKKLEAELERKMFEEEVKREAEKKLRIVNEEKSKIRKYYNNLLENLEQKLNMAELRKKILKKLLDDEVIKTETENFLDLLNENKVETVQEATNELDINSNAPPDEGIEATKNSDGSLSVENVIYDENSNPNISIEVEEQPECLRKMNYELSENKEINAEAEASKKEKNEVCKMSYRKSHRIIPSYRTVAAEEGAKNKCKVLKSEFGLDTGREPKFEIKSESSQNSLSDLERNRRKVLESEYNILKHSGDHISVKSVASKMKISSENSINPIPLPRVSSPTSKNSNFSYVELERKIECTNLENNQESNISVNEIVSDSCSSFYTPSNLSDENGSTAEGGETEVSKTNLKKSESNLVLVNPNYQTALLKDTEIFLRKLSYADIFCKLRDSPMEQLPCTDFMKFQRYIKRSVMVPLKIQEKLANDALLKHLLVGENLLSHLKSLRGYFFLNDGEFGRSFTYNTFRSLAKCTEPKQFFEKSNLSNIVNEALNYTIHNCEPNSQNLSFQIVKMPPFLNHSSHDVLSPFELSYKIEWPLNIILTEKALSKYRSVFQFLLKLKRINWTLNENFLLLNSQFKRKKLNGKVLVGSTHYHKIQIYRHAMTQVMITLDDYIFSNGIQFPWIFFLTDLETTENIDHLYQKHVRYIKDVLTRCFLSKNSEDLLDCIHNLIELALKFHYTTKSSVFEVIDGKYEHPKFEVLKNTFNEFCFVIKSFLKTLRDKISANQVLKSHYVLIEKFDLKLT